MGRLAPEAEGADDNETDSFGAWAPFGANNHLPGTIRGVLLTRPRLKCGHKDLNGRNKGNDYSLVGWLLNFL